MTAWRILEGDARDRLKDLDADSIQSVVTSPPYWADALLAYLDDQADRLGLVRREGAA